MGTTKSKPVAAVAATPNAVGNYLYEVRLIHRVHDWDVVLTFPAPNARKARNWALRKMALSSDWLVTNCGRKVSA